MWEVLFDQKWNIDLKIFMDHDIDLLIDLVKMLGKWKF